MGTLPELDVDVLVLVRVANATEIRLSFESISSSISPLEKMGILPELTLGILPEP